MHEHRDESLEVQSSGPSRGAEYQPAPAEDIDPFAGANPAFLAAAGPGAALSHRGKVAAGKCIGEGIKGGCPGRIAGSESHWCPQQAAVTAKGGLHHGNTLVRHLLPPRPSHPASLEKAWEEMEKKKRVCWPLAPGRAQEQYSRLWNGCRDFSGFRLV